MPYADTNFKTGKALKESFRVGNTITVYQPGPFGPTVRDGRVCLEGPHFPEPHRWWISVEVVAGKVTKVYK